jgi:polysaccharide biosynthesis/export protein
VSKPKGGLRTGVTKLRTRSTAVLAIGLLCSACLFRQDGPVISSGDRYAGAGDAVQVYRLGTGDRVRVSVYNETSLSGDFTVGAEGNLNLPLIGPVPARDRTVPEVAADVQQRYGNGYVRDPKVTADINVYRPFFILGEVNEPGQYPYSIGLTAMNAIATAQGYTARGDRKLVRIRRQGGTAEEIYRLTPDLRVYPGDTIRVGERFF